MYFSTATYLNHNINSAEELKIALPFAGNPPYSYGASLPPQGIYVDMLNEIFALTPYTPEYVYLPNARIRAAFKAGEIDIECCPIPSWRQSEQAISHYTFNFFDTTDLYISKNKIPSNELNSTPLELCEVMAINSKSSLHVLILKAN